jgi:chromosome segregation ATPase
MEEIGAGSQDLAELRFLDQDLDKSPSETKMILEDEAPATRKMQAFTNDEVDQLRIKALAKQVEDLKVENATALSSLADVEQELLSVRSQLQGEQHRSFRLEVEVAELRQKLSSMEQIQKELDLLQRQKVVFEKAASEASQKESTGVWGWLAGAPPAPRLE